MKDLFNNIRVVSSVHPQSISATTNGTGVDLQGFEGGLIVIASGAKSGTGDITPSIQHSNDNTNWENVPANFLQGSLTVLVANSVQRVGYIGDRRYVRVVLTASGTVTFVVSAQVSLGYPRHAPVS